MNVQLLEESVRDSAPFPVEEQQEMLNTVLSEVERLEDLLNEFLYFARPVPLQLLTIDFISFVQALVQFLAEDCRRKNIEIQLIAAPVPPFACDPKRLKQALLNLILNGIQAMPGGGIIKLMISHRREGVEILIADSGEGIKPEHMSKIFEPFFSAKKGGTGLGLAIVRQIIQRHRGTISIKSELGRGTTVHIHLPLTV